VVYSIGSKVKYEYAGNDLTTARAIDAKKKSDKKLGRLPKEFQPNKKAVTLADFIKKTFIPHFEGKNKGRPPYYIFNFFIKAFNERLLRDVTPTEIEEAVNKGSYNKTISTFNMYIAIIKRIFNHAIELEYIERSPVKVKKKINDNWRYRYLTEPEQKALLEACRHSNSPYLFEMVFIALYTGLRLGEIKTIRRESIANNEIIVKSEYSKSMRSRSIPLPPVAITFFETAASFDYNHDIKKAFKVALERAGIKDFTFHDLRHTYASRLVQSGVSLQEVKELLGHHTLEMTLRYAHLTKDNLKKAVNKLK
jgi:integrase